MFQTPVESAQKDLANSAEAYGQDAAYWGTTPLGTSWAYVYATNRDADILHESNWAAWLKTLKESGFTEGEPEDAETDYRIERAGHWACGWVEYLAVRVLVDPDKGVGEGNLTEVYLKVLDIRDDEDSYPVLDEEDYDERRREEALSALRWDIEYRQSQGTCPKYVTAEAVECWLAEHGVYIDESPCDEDIDDAIKGLREAAAAVRKQKRLARPQRAITTGQEALDLIDVAMGLHDTLV